MSVKTILVIEPDKAIGDLLAFFLKDQGYDVVTVESLEEGKHLLSHTRFDLIITEAFDQTHRYDLDPAFLVALKPQAGKSPIILLSTYVATNSVRPGDHGLADVIPKPFDVDVLLRKVNKAVRSRE